MESQRPGIPIPVTIALLSSTLMETALRRYTVGLVHLPSQKSAFHLGVFLWKAL